MKKKATVRLGAFREDPENVSEATEEEIGRLAGKLKRVPLGLTAMRIAYVTDAPGGGCMVISGNKRLRVLKQAYGEDGEVPADWFQDVTAMSEAERHEFRLNANVSDGHWNLDKLLEQYGRDEITAAGLDELLEEIGGYEGQDGEGGDNPEYQAFVDKFKPKKTTDDCYTPPIVYNAVRDWCVREYHLEGREIVRPFYPGGDYQHFNYPPRSVVIDNPPFSIISEILKWYAAKRIDFFLFAPALTLFSGCANLPRGGYVVTSSDVTYENGANVRTSFVTSLSPYMVDVRPDLWKIVDDANTENLRANKRVLPKLEYPMAVATAARLGYLSNHGIGFRFAKEDAAFIRKLDAQKDGDAIFGGAFLLSERAAASMESASMTTADSLDCGRGPS